MVLVIDGSLVMPGACASRLNALGTAINRQMPGKLEQSCVIRFMNATPTFFEFDLLVQLSPIATLLNRHR